MSRFKRVVLPEGRELRGRASQTLLRHFNGCERAGYLYQAHKGSVQTVEMARGSALHEVAERATQLMLEEGEVSMPPELWKVIVNEVLAAHPVPVEEHDYIREMSYRMAGELVIDPPALIACETLFVLDVDLGEGLGVWQVRAKVDRAELRGGGAQVYVADYKSSRAAPAYDDVARKRRDGTFATKNFQLILYGLAVVYGLPVRVKKCSVCGGRDVAEWVGPCENDCRRGWVEHVEPFSVAPRAQEVIAEFIYPGLEDSEGRMLRRTTGLTRAELEEYRESLVTVVRRLARAEVSGDWEAVLSDGACGECPCKVECPIPLELHDFRGTINTFEEAATAAERRYVRRKLDEALGKELRAFSKAHGQPIRFGKDRVLDFSLQERSTVDKEGLRLAVQLAVDLGEPFEWGDFVRTSQSTPFSERALSEEELAEEAQRARESSDEC